MTLIAAMVISVSCLGAAGLLATSIFSVARVIAEAESAVDPVLQAALPSLKHAGEVMATAARSSGAVERLINHTVTAADETVPAIRGAAAALEGSTVLVRRLSRLVSHPSIRVQMEPDVSDDV